MAATAAVAAAPARRWRRESWVTVSNPSFWSQILLFRVSMYQIVLFEAGAATFNATPAVSAQLSFG
jgi:hypothetical protein